MPNTKSKVNLEEGARDRGRTSLRSTERSHHLTLASSLLWHEPSSPRRLPARDVTWIDSPRSVHPVPLLRLVGVDAARSSDLAGQTSRRLASRLFYLKSLRLCEQKEIRRHVRETKERRRRRPRRLPPGQQEAENPEKGLHRGTSESARRCLQAQECVPSAKFPLNITC